MNERIKDFFLEAAKFAQTQEPTDYIAFTSIQAEKFAELIVRECIACARKDENGPAYEAISRIATHFGID